MLEKYKSKRDTLLQLFHILPSLFKITNYPLLTKIHLPFNTHQKIKAFLLITCLQDSVGLLINLLKSKSVLATARNTEEPKRDGTEVKINIVNNICIITSQLYKL